MLSNPRSGNFVSEKVGPTGRIGRTYHITNTRARACAFGLFAQKFKYLLRQAVQIFDVLRSIGGYHGFSAGIVIGGKNLKDERDRLSRMNILVATPGRLLQHMDQTVGFDCDSLQMLGARHINAIATIS